MKFKPLKTPVDQAANERSQQDFFNAIKSRRLLAMLTYILSAVLSLVCALALYFAGIAFAPAFCFWLFASTLFAIICIEGFKPSPVIYYQIPVRESDALQSAIHARISCTAIESLKEGYVTYLDRKHKVKEEIKHPGGLAVTGYFIREGLFTFWMFGTNSYVRDFRDYFDKIVL